MHNDGDYNRPSNCTVFNGNSVDIDVNHCDCEIRADVVVSEYQAVRLWGRIVNCEGKPVANALIKLIKIECDCKYEHYVGVAHTISDCEGFYQFELCNYDDRSSYKLLVSKATYGSKKVVPIVFNECDSCESPNVCSTDSCKTQTSNFKHTEHKCHSSESKCNQHDSKCNQDEVNYAYRNPKYYSRNK
jgi:hypothetical protein